MNLCNKIVQNIRYSCFLFTFIFIWDITLLDCSMRRSGSSTVTISGSSDYDRMSNKSGIYSITHMIHGQTIPSFRNYSITTMRFLSSARNSNVTWIALQLLLISAFTTILLMIHISSGPDEAAIISEINIRRAEAAETLRLEKLRKMQSTMFNPTIHKRPADSVYNINVTLSEHIPLERDIPDTRHPTCRDLKHNLDPDLTVTVIIPFYNEALSMLLRTVHSILKRTPPERLSQIILVNDHSLNEDLGKPLEEYIRLLPPKVNLVRTEKREGLIRARMIGAEMATGTVLMFQDAHTEANVAWLEPMLEVIQENPNTVVQPYVDQIEQWGLTYIGAGDHVPRGGWSWDLRYVWMELPQHEKDRLEEQSKLKGIPKTALPFQAAALVGCALAVKKDYFFHIGGFDDGMNIWGGENIELAMRTWLCGGRVLTHPCSRVAHTFKPFSYKFDGDRERIVQRNLMRIAELWMGDWKRFFLASTYNWPTKHTYFSEEEELQFEQRKAFMKELNCKSFDWYMKTVYADVHTPPYDATWYGEVTNLKTEACLFRDKDGYIIMTYFCFFHRFLPNNVFHMDDHGRLMYMDECIRIERNTWLLKIGECQDNAHDEHWYVEKTHEVEGVVKVDFEKDGHPHTSCLTQVTNVIEVGNHYKTQMPQVMDCHPENAYQYWRFQYMFDFNYDFNRPSS